MRKDFLIKINIFFLGIFGFFRYSIYLHGWCYVATQLTVYGISLHQMVVISYNVTGISKLNKIKVEI